MKVLKDFLMAICLLIAIFFVFIKFYKPEPQIRFVDRETTVTEVDTLYIEQPPITIEKEVILIDTVYISIAGEEIETESASIETTFTDSARLEVTYFITPRIYEINYRPARVQERTIREVETVYVDSSATEWWNNARYGYVAGVISTALLTFLVK